MYNRYFSISQDLRIKTDEPQTDVTAVLLVNLGSPNSATSSDVRVYLREFLSDPRVIEVNPVLWKVILECFILPFRPRRSAELYRNIWHEGDSPLLINTRALAASVQADYKGRGEENILVDYAMTYGKPSIREVMRRLVAHYAIKRFVVVPLYPQYSSTTTGAVFDAVTKELQSWRWIPEIKFLSSFYEHPLYIEAIAQSVLDGSGLSANSQQSMVECAAELKGSNVGRMLVLSFHGIPQRYVANGDPYYNHCQRTGHLIAKRLGLSQSDYMISFQSRFGKEPWLQPYTDQALLSLPARGVTAVDIICPGFICDCLETLEEIACEGQKIFEEAGGKHYKYIPSLNSSGAMVKLIEELVRGVG